MGTLEKKQLVSFLGALSFFLMLGSGRAIAANQTQTQTQAQAQTVKAELPLTPLVVSSELKSFKNFESKEKWESCAKLGPAVFQKEKRIRGWILRSWLYCSRRHESKLTILAGFAQAALKAVDANPQLRVSGPWVNELNSEIQKNRFLIVEKNLATKSVEVPRQLDLLLEETEPADKEVMFQIYKMYGELAQFNHQLERALTFYQQSLRYKEQKEIRDKIAALFLALGESRKNEEPDLGGEEFVSEGEKKFEDRFDRAQKANDLLALEEDIVSYLGRYPNGRKAKWASDKLIELVMFFSDSEKKDEEKWMVLKERSLSLALKAEPQRLSDWARVLHRAGYFYESLLMSEKALDRIEQAGLSSRILFYMAGRSAQFLGLYKQAQKHLEGYVEAHSAGEEITEVLFRLGTVYYRQKQFSNAVAVFERLLSLGTEKGELSARYWMIRAMQEMKVARANKEIETLLAKFPFSYFGLKLKAEQLKGKLEWPYAVEGTLAAKKALYLTGAHLVLLERVRVLAAAGFRDEALAEIRVFPEPEDAHAKVVLAKLWADVGAYQVAIKLLGQAVDQGVEYRTQDWVSLGLPKDHLSEVEAEAKKYGLNPILVWSLMRQESAFNNRAVSSSRAMGLMQMIPGTAREIADRLKIGPLEYPSDMFVPERNIQMGTWYLSEMLKKFQNSVPMALAAYNAGPHRIQKFWQKRGVQGPEAQDELWVDELPWQETSLYVKAILRNALLYKLIDQRELLISQDEWRDLVTIVQ